VDWSENPPLIPTQPGQFEAIEANLVDIVKKLDKLPLEAIGVDLQKALAQLDVTLAGAHGTLGNVDLTLGHVDKLIEPDSLLREQLGNTLQEVNGAARGLRLLADYLERHPEALIRGKPGEAK